MAIDMPVRAVREQIIAAIDVVVQMARFASGQRRITHISEVTGLDPDTTQIHLEDVMVLRDPEQPRLRHTGYLPSFTNQLVDRGQLNVDVFL